MDEQPRTDATSDEQGFTLTVEEAAELYAQAGFPRTLRAIQKYCARDDLLCMREQTTYGERFRITPASVARHIEQIKQLSQANGRDHSRPDATVRTEVVEQEPVKNDEATVREQPRPDANDTGMLDQLKGEVQFLRGEIAIKNEQIKDLTERARETNHLIGGLQKMLTPLLGRGGEERVHTYTPDDGGGDNNPAG
jgi:hypothetical protein